MAIPMSVATEGAAGNLVPNDFERTVIELTVGESEVLKRIPASSRYFLERINDVVPVTYTGMTPQFIDEGGVKQQSYPVFVNAPLNGHELAVLTAATDRLVENSVVALESLIAREAVKGFAKVLDDAIMHNAPTSWDCPAYAGSVDADFENACIQTGQIVTGGGTVDDVAKFFSAMLAHLEANENWDQAQTVWFVRRGARQAIRDGRTSNGEPLFVPDPINQDGRQGSIYGIPVQEVVDSKWPTDYDAFIVDMSKVAWGAKADAIKYAKSNTAAYTVSETLVSAFEKNETVYKWSGMYAFTIIDLQAVAGGKAIEDAVPAA